MNATPRQFISTPLEESGLDELYMTAARADKFLCYKIQPQGSDDIIGWCLEKKHAREIVRAVNSYDAMREALHRIAYDLELLSLDEAAQIAKAALKLAEGG